MMMADMGLWSVDRLAAGRLIAELKLDASDMLIDKVARHFAEHRLDMVEWAAERVHGNAIRRLEAASAATFARHGEQWVQGFCHAEEAIATTQPAELLDLEPEAARSTGQFLRGMVRAARRSPA